MPHGYTEDGLVEQPAVKLFAELGWQTASGEGETFGAAGSLGRASNREPVLIGRLRAALEHLNPKAPASAIGAAVDALTQDRSAMSLVGANRDYILNHVPHIGRLLVDTPEALFEHAEVVVMATAEKDFGDIAARLGQGKQLIDLVGIWKNEEQVMSTRAQRYAGIAW